jgi:hypothetical protein
MSSEIAVGPCPHCQQELAQLERTLPRRLSLRVRRLDDAARRWYAARESSRIGHGDGHLRPHSPGGLNVADAALAPRMGYEGSAPPGMTDCAPVRSGASCIPATI